jgi:1-deoxy-D-xylulose-5-phosphate synthase
MEDHVLPGGYGSSVCELLNDKRINTPVLRIGWPDQFIEHASTVEYLRNKYGLTAPQIATQIKAQFNAAQPANVTSLSAVA